MLQVIYNTKTLKDMSEHDNLQDADGDNLNATPQEHSSTENPTTSEETPTEEVTSSETPTRGIHRNT